MTQSNNRNFFIRRFHSLIALIPIGIFVCVHLLLNSGVFFSADGSSYVAVVHFMKTAPFIKILEVVLIALPLLFHAIYGIYIVYLAKNNPLKFTYYRNWAFYLQRISAIIIVLFLIWHVYTLRLSGIHDPAEVVGTLAGILQNPLFFALYIIGVAAALYHFANGFFTFCITWGICVGEKAQKIFAAIAILLFVALFVFALAILTRIVMIY